MQRTSITIPSDLIDELMTVLKARSKTDAVMRAIRAEIKARKKEKLKAMAGRMDFSRPASELRHGDRRLG